MSLVDVLQRVLAVEHAAVYGYGLLGAQLSGTELGAAQAAFAVHQTRRDAVTRRVRDLGGDPVVALPAYLPRTRVVGRPTAIGLAVQLEDDGAAAYVEVLGATDDSTLRRAAVEWLSDATVRGHAWRAGLGSAALAAQPPLPGLTGPPRSPSPSSPSP